MAEEGNVIRHWRRALLSVGAAALAACAHAPAPVAPAALKVATLAFDDATRPARIAAAAAALEPARKRYFESLKAPGLAFGVVVGDQLVYFQGQGVREVASAAPVDDQTVFRIASMTKAFVSAAVLRLRDEGKLQLDDLAEKHLPELRGLVYPTEDSPRLTVRQLISHSGGLPEDNASADLRMPMSDAEMDALLARGLSFSTAPGTQFEYSNLGFALAGRLVTRVAGERVQDYVARTLLAPLGMAETRWDGAAVPEAHRAHGYGRKGSNMPAAGLAKYGADEAFHEEPLLADGAFAPIGGLFTSPRDYAKWIAFQLAAWPPRDGPDGGPVRRASLREAHQQQRFSGLSAGRSEGGELSARAAGYGFGWGVSQSCLLERVVAHSGGLPGYGSHVLLLPERGVGFFSMTNLTYTNGAKAIGELIESLEKQGLIPARPVRASAQLEAARGAVLALLARFDPQEAAVAFDHLYSVYESMEQLEQRLATLRARHGACRAGPLQPENALRGKGVLLCERGEIALAMTLTADAPPRIQSLALESALPPSPRMRALATRAAALFASWDDGAAAELFDQDSERAGGKEQMARAAREHGPCQQPEPLLGDGDTNATFRLACAHGDLDLALQLAPATGRAAHLALAASPDGPRCSR